MGSGKDSSSLRSMKSGYLKKKGDEFFKEGNYRGAIDAYGECLKLRQEKAGCEVIYSNRSLAYSKCNKHDLALKDASRAIAQNSSFVKAHWRKAIALKHLKCPLEAVAALREALALDVGNEEVKRELRMLASGQFTRNQIAQYALGLIARLVEEGSVEPARHESVSDEEMEEAFFRAIYVSEKEDLSAEGRQTYREKACRWVVEGMKPQEAYLERSVMYVRAKCFAQASSDAKHAAACILTASQGLEGAPLEASKLLLAQAYAQVGAALSADASHEACDLAEASRFLSRACELDGSNARLQARLQEVHKEMTPEQASRAARRAEASEIAGVSGWGAASLLDSGPSFRLDASVTFEGHTAQSFGAGQRDGLRCAIAERLNCAKAEVQMEGIRVAAGYTDGALRVGYRAVVRGAREQAEKAAAELRDPNLMAEALARCGGIVRGASSALTEVSDGKATRDELRRKEIAREIGDLEIVEGAEEDEDEMALPSRPKYDIELPYKLYKIVTSEGKPMERQDKHGFCMSRCYYSSKELPAEEPWVEICDGSCRWRQSSDEVKVIALQVPTDLSSDETKQRLRVLIEPYNIKVWDARTQEVYLEGRLERGVIPEQCLWEYSRGKDGFVFYLKKMNLELLSKPHQHAEMWWPRLFQHHLEIAWDDYEKDYSDLPAEIMQQHAARELKDKHVSNLEHGERLKRESLQERDDVRKRKRQERLHEMRTGQSQTWVELQRRNPPKSILSKN